VGDLNDYTETDGMADPDHGLRPILNTSLDMIKRIRNPFWRWTTFYPKMQKYQLLDYILTSLSLAWKNPWAIPWIIRQDAWGLQCREIQGPQVALGWL
jgi:hypothetical protein